jgi:hypothetical protein
VVLLLGSFHANAVKLMNRTAASWHPDGNGAPRNVMVTHRDLKRLGHEPATIWWQIGFAIRSEVMQNLVKIRAQAAICMQRAARLEDRDTRRRCSANLCADQFLDWPRRPAGAADEVFDESDPDQNLHWLEGFEHPAHFSTRTVVLDVRPVA